MIVETEHKTEDGKFISGTEFFILPSAPQRDAETLKGTVILEFKRMVRSGGSISDHRRQDHKDLK